MSFIDDIIGVGKTALGYLSGNGLGSSVLRTVISGVALNQITKSISKSSDNSTTTTTAEQGVNISTTASTESKIPVLYGRAVTGGQLVDVRMSNDNQTMTYVYAISEVTGNLLSTGSPSAFSFNNIYWSGYKINFQNDGITLASIEDLQGNTRTNWAGEIRVWCYRNGSANGILPVGFSGAPPVAWTVVPEWTASWQMTNLVFAVVQVNYVRKYNLVGIGEMTFDVSNSMTLPGDVLYDITTNTRYGASISPADIKEI
jgi:hypothetical protein